MPSLKDAIAASKSPNLVPVSAAPAVIAAQPLPFPTNANMRCILPPFNADPDSVRQFSSASPQIRIWPQPQQKSSASTSTTATGAASTSSSSSSSSSSSTLSAKVVTFTTGSLPPGGIYQTTVQMAKSFQLISMTVTSASEVRIYGTQQAQIFDASRPTGNPVPPEISTNIITCVTFQSPLSWGWQNRIGANQNDPQSVSIYCSVFNTVPTSGAAVTVTISYLPLES
jgi:hypothetical protein